MAAKPHSCNYTDEDYMDMEVSLHSQFLCHPIISPPHPREFEFQMFSSTLERETTTSPADELFYKGKLLPLHLPPRFQMVGKLLQISSSYDHKTDTFEEFFSTPLTTTTTTTPIINTQFESCNISPSESCHVSKELNPDEYFFEYSTELSSSIGDNPKKSRKLKLIKHSLLGSKLKASRTYLKSWFRKSSCSDESCKSAARNVDEGSILKIEECLNKYVKEAKRAPFRQIQKDTYNMPMTATRSFNKEQIAADGSGHCRSSFSGAIKTLLKTKSSSSCSSNSKDFNKTFSNRSSSANSDVDNPIQGAIAYCKRSQQQYHSR